jgi:3-oxo-5-alpha-steroid 4-dehydrogenase 1
MSEQAVFEPLLYVWLMLAVITFVALLRRPAPYGRHADQCPGPCVNATIGWVLMEMPASLLFLLWFLLGTSPRSITALVFFVMWQAHYVDRAFVYPFTLGRSAHPVPLLIVALSMLFNSVNTYINGRYLFTFSGGYPDAWLLDARFWGGLALFGGGYLLNRHADRALRRARLSTGLRYCRLDDGIFRAICCPNYLGEILIWTGWAIATWSLAGLSFAVWTAANLVPRARAHLGWCRSHFDGYPVNRRALIPGLW